MTSLAPTNVTEPSLTPPPPINVIEPPAEGKTKDAESAEQQWYRDSNAEPLEGFDDADYSEDKPDSDYDPFDDEEGKEEPGYRPPSPITPDGIEDGNSKIDPITPDGIECKVEPPPSPSRGDEGNPEPAPKRRRFAADGGSLSFGEDAAGRPELKPLNYFGWLFEKPSVRLGRRLIVSRPRVSPRLGKDREGVLLLV